MRNHVDGIALAFVGAGHALKAAKGTSAGLENANEN